MKLRTLVTLSIVFGAYACSSADSSPGPSGDYPTRPKTASGKADAWNAKSDPEKFADFLRGDLEYHMDKLPLEGRADAEPWPETYWPTDQDGPNYRWHDPKELSPLEKYDTAFNGWNPSAGFMDLRPLRACGEPFDKAYYDKLGPAAKWWSDNRGNLAMRDNFDNDHDGLIDECGGDSDGIEGWMGLCHAWTPAALLEPEPMYAIEYNGVTFYPSDIKALLIATYDHSVQMMLGGRCFLKSPPRDENGRIIDQDCRDVNAGSFHVIATNFLGRYHMGFAEDRTYDEQIWNQPVYDFKVNELHEIDAAQANDLLNTPGPEYTYNPDALRFWEVRATLRYVTESSPSTEPTTPKLESYLKPTDYYYIVEGDAEGNIIGGEWISAEMNNAHGASPQPDYLWVATGPDLAASGDPALAYANVKKLLAKALNDPGEPEPTNICANLCDDTEPKTQNGRTCHCDASCFTYGDCCQGRIEACGSTTGSCKGHCGQSAAAPGSVPPDLCYCNPACAQAGDCCADYIQYCK
jgi:Transglutaminase elicitor/Somatomedin B domain